MRRAPRSPYLSSVTDRDQQVRDSDRQAAIQAVESALAVGRIIQADHDLRIEQLKHAQTSDEVRMVIHDLPHRAAEPAVPDVPAQETWSTYQPSDTVVASGEGDASEPRPPPPYAQPPYAQPPYGAPAPTSTATPVSASSGGMRAAKILVPLILAIVAIGIGASVIAGFTGANDTFDDLVEDFEIGGPGSEPEPEPPNVLSVDGYGDVVAAVRQETGSSEVFQIVIYPEYAVVDVPVDKTSGRQRSLFWDGDLGASGSTGTTDFDRFDLADLDPAVVTKMAKRARGLVPGQVDANYLIIRSPQDFDQGVWIYAYANNEFNEGGYLAADKKGKVLRRVTD